MKAALTPWLLILSALVSWYLTRVWLSFARQRSILDVPNERSSHTIPTPRGGGGSFVLVFLGAIAVLAVSGSLRQMEALGLMAGTAVAIVGGWDDCVSLPIRLRLPVHLFASLTAVFCLLEYKDLLSSFGSWAVVIPVAAVACVGMVWLVNLTNFMDGIDGLAGTETVTVALICAAISIAAHGLNVVAVLFAVLAAAVFGFLVWNWHPSHIFMGDVGSGFLGYCFGALTLLGIARHALSPFVPLILFGGFVVDASYTLLRRVTRGERWYEPHRSHAFQHMSRRLGHARTTLIFAAVNLLWLAPLAWAAQSYAPHAVLCLVIAWTPLLVAAQVIRAGEPESCWSLGHDPLKYTPKHHTQRVLARSGAQIIQAIYRLMDKHGPLVKHVLLAMINVTALYLALLTRFDGNLPSPLLHHFEVVGIVWCLVQGAVLVGARVTRRHWRYASAEEVPLMSVVALIASLAGGAAAWLAARLLHVSAPSVPRSMYLLDALYSVALLGTMWVLSRNLLVQARLWTRERARTRVLIYGADGNGTGVLAELRRNGLDYRAIGFLDPSPAIRGLTYSGVPVLGAVSDLPRLSKKHGIDLVLIPSQGEPSPDEKALVQICLDEKLEFRAVRTITDEITVRRPRLAAEIVVEDLLGRKPLQLDVKLVEEKLRGEVVMVTGAAGSIGSELCRQIARFNPRAIVGYEISETALFYMERHMRELFPTVSFIPCIGSVQNRARLNDVLCAYKPSTVYHAAAYKHVPLMEQHIFEAIENNIFGTQTLLRACEDHGVSSFVMISTDKAARPTSLMGCSKRVAEMLVRASRSSTLTCVSTRFGNVLGSNGSVVPLFREQIIQGGPVKVTHPAMVRFFMTIPEAAQLVLQASSLGSANEIYVLDMGAPVKIVDLAERMIRLAGLIPGRDIAIEYTGMRPGEKLYEELSNSDEELLPTTQDGIYVFRSDSESSALELSLELENLRAALDARSAEDALRILQRIVPDYTPSHDRSSQLSVLELTGPALNVA